MIKILTLLCFVWAAIALGTTVQRAKLAMKMKGLDVKTLSGEEKVKYCLYTLFVLFMFVVEFIVMIASYWIYQPAFWILLATLVLSFAFPKLLTKNLVATIISSVIFIIMSGAAYYLILIKL